MIFKYFETQKIKIEENNFVLLYGKNNGLKNETTLKLTKNKGQISNYEEREILENSNNFLEDILSKSLTLFFKTTSFLSDEKFRS